MTSLGYGFAYAAWIRSSEIKCGWASEGYHYYYAFKTLQRPPEIWEDGTPTSVDYDNDCAP